MPVSVGFLLGTFFDPEDGNDDSKRPDFSERHYDPEGYSS
jgi:hypothetical protein